MRKIVAAACGAAALADVSLVTFDGAKETTHTWQEMNDPVMGGRSTGTFTIKDEVGIFDGEVADVPFLKAAGFITTRTDDTAAFPDVSGCENIDITCKAGVDYAGFRLSFGTAHAAGGKSYAYGYKSHFTPKVGEFSTVSIPISSFTDYWDDATGEPIKTCQDDSVYCPDEKTLKDMQTITVWAEGVKGKVHLEIQSISASGCSTQAGNAAGAGKSRICPAIPNSAKECKIKNITDPEFEAVCLTRAEPAEQQQRRCMPGKTAPYYKDSEGVFRCACCGAPLWEPSKQFDQLPETSWPWPSFHSSPVNGDDGLPNVCHRGPGFGITQRNATQDLGSGALGEIGCARCGAHLGDYFNDETDGKDHYCIDGVCMAGPGQTAGQVCAPTTGVSIQSVVV